MGLLFVVGEECGSDGGAANRISPGPAFLGNGEPTESKLATATREAFPLLDLWGAPLVSGPGSVLDAHTDGDHVTVAELEGAAAAYERMTRALLEEAVRR